MTIYLNISHVLDAHEKVLKESGGTPGALHADYLEGILEFIQNDDYYPSFAEKLSYLTYSIAANHCFIDGNKRTAIATGMYFLIINDYDKETISKFAKTMENIIPFTLQHTLSKDDLFEIITYIVWDIEPVESKKLEYIQKLSNANKWV